MRTGERRVGELLKILDQVFSAAVASACRGLPEDQAEDIALAWNTAKREIAKELRASKRRQCQLRKLARALVLPVRELDPFRGVATTTERQHAYAAKLAEEILARDERMTKATKNRLNRQDKWGGTGSPIPKAHERQVAWRRQNR